MFAHEKEMAQHPLWRRSGWAVKFRSNTCLLIGDVDSDEDV